MERQAEKPDIEPMDVGTDRISWIERGGRRILYVDYSDLDAPGMVELAHKAGIAYGTVPETGARVLVNASNTAAADSEAMTAMRDAVGNLRGKDGRLAVAGVSGIQLLLLRAINLFAAVKFVPFPSVEDAQAWLAQED